MFRIEQNPNRKGDILGYKWIEVLAIEPWAIADPKNLDGEYGDWCAGVVKNLCVCNTNARLQRITSDDLLASIEQYAEYRLVQSTAEGNGRIT